MNLMAQPIVQSISKLKAGCSNEQLDRRVINNREFNFFPYPGLKSTYFAKPWFYGKAFKFK